MPDHTNEQDRHQTSSNQTEDRALSRRNILLGTSTLVAAAAMTSGALAQGQKAAPASPAPPRRLLLRRLLRRLAANPNPHHLG